MGLKFVVGGAAKELTVASYSWGASNPTGGTRFASLQNFTLQLAPTSAEPGLWGNLAAGSRLNFATIHVRTPTKAGLVELLTYTLTDVNITSFSTSGSSGFAPIVTIQLAYNSVSESYASINAAGTPDTNPNIAQYDRIRGTSSGSGNLSVYAAARPAVGVTFSNSGTNSTELAVANYSWGAVHPSNAKASLQSFMLTLRPTSAQPGLWGSLAVGKRFSSVNIRVRNSASAEFITYTLTNVAITSFSTASSPIEDAPQATIQLAYDALSESYFPSNLDGSLPRFPNTVTYNQTSGATSSTPKAALFLSVNSSADVIAADSSLSLLEAVNLANGTLSFSALSAAEKALITAEKGWNTSTTFATRPLDVKINLAPGTYGDVVLNPPAGMRVILKGSGKDTIIDGHSPALTVNGGDVRVENVVLETTTDSPTVLVTDGTLTLRDDVIKETPGYDDPDVAVTGGKLDLGVPGDPGHNEFEGQGNFLWAADPSEVTVYGDWFEVDGTTNTGSEPTYTTITTLAAATLFGQSVRLTATTTAWNGETHGRRPFL